MSTPVEQIKTRLSIVDVIGSYIKLTKAGNSYKALCPFHTEKTPSFNVSPTRDAFYCFGCNRGGDIFTFVSEIEGVEFRDALKILADRAGVVLPAERSRERGERERLRKLLDDATTFYEAQLEKYPEARSYLRSRGLSDETIRNFRIGYAPLEWRGVYEQLRQKRYTDEEIEKVGLVKRPDDSSRRPYDRFRGRIMFPISDPAGNIVAFSGRILGEQKNPDGTTPAKYVNSPETVLYDKGAILFGYDKAKTAIRKQNFAVVVEGQMDLIMAHQAGTTNAVAVSGTALTERHLALLKRLTDNIVFALDADDAGVEATMRSLHIALREGFEIRIATIPLGKDPADVIKNNPELWIEALKKSSWIIDYYLTVLEKKGYDERTFREEAMRFLVPLILAIPNKVVQREMIEAVGRRSGIELAIWEEMVRRIAAEGAKNHLAPESEEERRPSRTRIKSRRQLAEEEIIGILWWQEGHPSPAIDVPRLRSAYDARLKQYQRIPITLSPDEEQNLVFRIENTYAHDPALEGIFEELLDTLEIEMIRERQGELLRMIGAAEEEGRKDEAHALLEAYRALTPRQLELENKRRASA